MQASEQTWKGETKGLLADGVDFLMKCGARSPARSGGNGGDRGVGRGEHCEGAMWRDRGTSGRAEVGCWVTVSARANTSVEPASLRASQMPSEWESWTRDPPGGFLGPILIRTVRYGDGGCVAHGTGTPVSAHC